MKKIAKSRKLVSLFLAVLLCVGLCITPVSATAEHYSAETGAAIISLSEAEAQRGETVSITVSIENNPGIAVASIALDYDKNVFSLESVKNGEIFSSLDTGLNLFWSADQNCIGDGVIATLTFKVSPEAKAKAYTISAILNEAIDENARDVAVGVSNGKIVVSGVVYGDADGNGAAGSSDVLLLRKYVANYNYTTGLSAITVQAGADANGDGSVDSTDVLLLRKYMANYNYRTGTSTIVLGPSEPSSTVAPVTTAAPVTNAPATQAPAPALVPYKASISMNLTDDGNGVYAADEIFSEFDAYTYVEKGTGISVGVTNAADKVNKIEATLRYAWDGEYIYCYLVAYDPTLLAVGEDIADDPYKNWSYDGFELWYKLGSAPTSKAQLNQFWASLNGYALNAQDYVKSSYFDDIEWNCVVNRDTKTSYVIFKIPARTESGTWLKGGDSFYTAIQLDDCRDSENKVYYCATKNPTLIGGYDRYILEEATANEISGVIPYKANISIDLADNGEGVYVADEIFSVTNAYAYVELGKGYAGSSITNAGLENKIETTVSYAWDGEYIYGYVVAYDPTLSSYGRDIASDYDINWKLDSFELWYKFGGKAPAAKADVRQFWLSLYGYAITAFGETKSEYFDGIIFDSAVNEETKTAYLTFKIPARTETGAALNGGDSIYTALQLDDRRSETDANAWYCSTSNHGNYAKGYNEYVLADAPASPAITVPYKENISIDIADNGDGVYVADEIFAENNTYAYVERGVGYSVGITDGSDKVNKIETTVSYAWDGEYIYLYVVANDPTLLAVGEDIASDPYKNWSYDGFELWYKLGDSDIASNQFWASLNGYALNAQTKVKSVHFDNIAWDCKVNRTTNTSYLAIKIPAMTEDGAALQGGDSFYTAIQMDDCRNEAHTDYYCSTYNQQKGFFDRYVLESIVAVDNID